MPMMLYGCKAYDTVSGATVHITGRWESLDAMADELIANGYVVLNYWTIDDGED